MLSCMVGPRAILLAAALTPVPSHAPPAWQWPLRPPPRVVRGFSPPAHPWEAGHRGVDLAARPGRPVYAAGPGRVGFAGDLAGRGVVTIVHGALRTTYLPVRPAVRAGQTVRAGDRIGVVAAAPGHCGARTCLHWGLLRGFTYLDPLRLLGFGPVRLLPWWPAAPGATATGAEGVGAASPGGLGQTRAGTRPPGPPARAAHTTPTRVATARRGGRETADHRRVSPHRSLAARLTGAAAPAGAGVAGGLIALGMLGAARPSTLGARLRRRIARP